MIEAFARARIAERRKEPFKNGQHLITCVMRKIVAERPEAVLTGAGRQDR